MRRKVVVRKSGEAQNVVEVAEEAEDSFVGCLWEAVGSVAVLLIV